MEEKARIIKQWLGSGSINIFGLPMSGKDTVGVRLAELLGAEFLSSGDIIRAYESKQNDHMTDSGALIPTNKFYDIVLPHFYTEELIDKPLVLSSIGRWKGEEDEVMKNTKDSGHEIKAVIYLKLSENDVRARWNKAKELGDRGSRADDMDPEVFETRITEFHEKTEPVLKHYDNLNLLFEIDASADRDTVFENVVNALSKQ